ncbi:MAG: autotransporter domain-containing protein [Endomicrobium sp.]|jgi:outer membrane autotransporter protein|nr:autotransporter domain-containing protein [Endomicrobium sp.]
MNINANKIFFVFVFMFLFGAVSFASDIIFFSTDTPQDVYNKMTQVNSSNRGVFKGDICISSEVALASGSSLVSDDPLKRRILTSSGGGRFFRFDVSNASITLNGISLADGRYTQDNTAGGGAIFVSGTNFYLYGDYAFERNLSTTSLGGAFYLQSGTAYFYGQALFAYNAAGGGYGGAIYSGGGVTFASDSFAVFYGNRASLDGGAVYAGSGNAEFGSVTMSSNTSVTGSGGAVYASGDIRFNSQTGDVSLISNSAHAQGGALYSAGQISFAGNAKISANETKLDSSSTTFHNGGAIYAADSVMFNSVFGYAQLIDNKAAGSGGAILSSASVYFNGSAVISGNNIAHPDSSIAGGAIWADGGIYFQNAGVTVFITSNTADNGSGGALFSNTSIVSFNGYAQVYGNKATGSGGAIYSNGLLLSNGGEFINNEAGEKGGAVYLKGGTSYILSDNNAVLFSGNTANKKRNDIFIDALNSSAVLNLETRKSGNSITFDGGIQYASSGAYTVTVNKLGAGGLYLNGDNELNIFNVSAGTVAFGAQSSFKADSVDLRGSNVFIDMRNDNNSDVLYITSSIVSNASSKLYFDIDSDTGKSDTINGSGTADINATLIKIGLSGIDASTKTYRILSLESSSGTGSFNIDYTNGDYSDTAVSTVMTRVHVKVLYDGQESKTNWQNVDIAVKIDQLNVLPGLTNNQLQNALALDRNYGHASGDLFYIIDKIDQMNSESAKKDALNDLAGHIFANVITYPALNASKNNILSRLKRSYFIPDGNALKRNVWAQGYSSYDKYKGDINSPGDFSASAGGVAAGFDTMKNEQQIFGISVGYSDAEVLQNSDKININEYSVGGYGAYFFDNNFDVKFMFMGGRQNYDSARRIRYLSRTAKASFTGLSLNASVEGAYDYYYKNDIYFRPFAGLDFSYVSTQEFDESQAVSADLTVYAASYNRLNAVMGFQVNNGSDMRLKWYAEFKFDLLAAGKYGVFKGEYKNSGNSFEIKGIENGVFGAIAGAGLLYDFSSKISAYANLNGTFLGTQTGYYANLGVNYKFSTQITGFYDK